MTSILGISAFYHDSAATLIKDGKIVAAAQEELTNAISDMGQEPDAAIIGKLTGKAAKYFAELLNKLND